MDCILSFDCSQKHLIISPDTAALFNSFEKPHYKQIPNQPAFFSKFWYDHEGRGFVFDPTGDWSDPYS